MNQPPKDTGRAALGKFWTVPNILSLLRLALSIPLFAFIYSRGPGDRIVLGLVVLVVITDWLDGKLARVSKTVSDWGKVIDPIADKLTGLLAILALTLRGDTVFTWGFVAFMVTRDVFIVSGAAVISLHRRRVSMSTWSGKISSGMLALTVLAVLLQADPPIPTYLLWATIVMLSYSFLRYLVRYLAFRRGLKSGSEEVVSKEAESAAQSI